MKSGLINYKSNFISLYNVLMLDICCKLLCDLFFNQCLDMTIVLSTSVISVCVISIKYTLHDKYLVTRHIFNLMYVIYILLFYLIIYL
jgi:hypothetical protein